jgi:hypothetical protein
MTGTFPVSHLIQGVLSDRFVAQRLLRWRVAGMPDPEMIDRGN